MYLIEPHINESPSTFIVFRNFFSLEECEKVRKMKEQIPAEEAKTASNSMKRISEIRWIHCNDWTRDLFDRLAPAVVEANKNHWHFNLTGFCEPLQLTTYYSDKMGHYNWHADRCDRGIGQNRKISGSLILNDDYEGGEFEIFDGGVDQELLKTGALILFPSFMVHRVRPVLKGVRDSLVTWVSGPAWV